ncbi:hypothetical protein [Mycobacterium sp. 1245805.9]|uniref:hypothetical protein n=1 Tax=Mycobacterium sp. 1245805.9 TaxID=1856862 RepID=UPI0007FE44DB|nr:hypothetical protein [Mycobacterium sp. 1245805.9]OBI81460.1 hypothetical protein A9X00_09075 [Mycobacterium sp. 1245805.9]
MCFKGFRAHNPNAPAIARGSSDPFDRMRHRGPEASGDVLRLGVLYADGRRGETTGGSQLHFSEGRHSREADQP